jgi:hypothetical protein
MKLVKINESQRKRLFEAYNSDLYHFTNFEGINGILEDDCLSNIEVDDEEVVCLSRTSNPYIGFSPYGNLIYRITIDTDKALSSIRNIELKPWSKNNPRTSKGFDGKYRSVSDFEERSYESIYPLHEYCKSIDIFTQYPTDWLSHEDINEIRELMNRYPQWRNYFHFFGNKNKKIDIKTILGNEGY